MNSFLDKKSFDADEVLNILPHRYPFLLIDKVIEVSTPQPMNVGMEIKELADLRKGTIVRAIKNVTFNEPQFQGHFPGAPVFPGVLTLEAMAQAAVFTTVPYLLAINKGKLPQLQVALAGVDRVRFRRPIKPGDQMEIKVLVANVRDPLWSFVGEVTLNGESKKAAEANFMAYLSHNANE